MYGLIIERVNLKSSEKKDVEDFLLGFNLSLDEDVECTLIAKLDGKIVGTCSFSGNILKCFAVKEDMQGEGIASSLITNLINILFDNGIYGYFVFTKKENKGIFEGLGFKKVEEAEGVLLLEGGRANVLKYVSDMVKKSSLGNEKKASLVVNCNPFTLGHRYLIEKAARENERVVVFVVEEEKSLFPFNVRLDLVKKGVSDLKNVTVIGGGQYIISSRTFPSYFLRKIDERLRVYTSLDVRIFGRYIAPAFNINKRYVGTEPYCDVTCAYNKALLSILIEFGVNVELIERIKINDNFVSASKVRELIHSGNIEGVRELVPQSTYEFLISREGLKIIEKIKGSNSPH